MMDEVNDPLRERLVAFYARHNPVRLQTMDAILESWRDDEVGLFEALREKYNLDENFEPIQHNSTPGKTQKVPIDDDDSDLIESVPQNLSPIQQLEFRSRQMEKYLTQLFLANSSDQSHEETAISFRDNAAAFSEICLGILKTLKAGPLQIDTAVKRETSEPHLSSTGSVKEVKSSSFQEVPAQKDADISSDPLVHDVMPLDVDAVADRVLSTVIRTKCRDGDILNVHPGIYRDNIIIAGLKVQLRAASVLKDRPVVIVAADTSLPLIQVKDKSIVSLQGIDFTSSTDRNGQSVPLVTCDTASSVIADDCLFIGGGGGLMVGGADTRLEMNNCSFRECAFAGIYAKGGAKVNMLNCKAQQCEVGVRVRDAFATIDACECISSTSDGITFHGNCKASVSRTILSGSKENGAMLSPSSVVSFQSCELKNNGQFGLYVPAGAEYIADGCVFGANNMGNYNRAPPVASQLHAITRRLN